MVVGLLLFLWGGGGGLFCFKVVIIQKKNTIKGAICSSYRPIRTLLVVQLHTSRLKNI